MYFVTPENLLIVPLCCGSPAACCGSWPSAPAADRLAGAVPLSHALPCTWRRRRFDMPNLAVSDYKGVSYARKFPDAERVYARASPFGYLEVYSSSYLHFAPGLSDNAAFNLPTMPANTYLGLYIDGEGPSGIMRDLPAPARPPTSATCR